MGCCFRPMLRMCLQVFPFSQLPATLLTRVLQSLPQRERLTSCATVCKSWADAAAAATVEVDIYMPHGRPHHALGRSAAFQAWLEQHAGQLMSLRVLGDYDESPKFHLPFFKLQQLSRLDLEGLDVHLNPAAGSSSSNAGAAPMPGKLLELRLRMCNLSCITFLQLAQLSGVTSLDLEMCPDTLRDISFDADDRSLREV